MTHPDRKTFTVVQVGYWFTMPTPPYGWGLGTANVGGKIAR